MRRKRRKEKVTFELEEDEKRQLVVQLARVPDLLNKTKVIKLLQTQEPRNNRIRHRIRDILALHHLIRLPEICRQQQEGQQDTPCENPPGNRDLNRWLDLRGPRTRDDKDGACPDITTEDQNRLKEHDPHPHVPDPGPGGVGVEIGNVDELELVRGDNLCLPLWRRHSMLLM